MQSTGVYWIAVYDILEAAGFEVYLVNARETKNLPGDAKATCRRVIGRRRAVPSAKRYRPADEVDKFVLPMIACRGQIRCGSSNPIFRRVPSFPEPTSAR